MNPVIKNKLWFVFWALCLFANSYFTMSDFLDHRWIMAFVGVIFMGISFWQFVLAGNKFNKRLPNER